MSQRLSNTVYKSKRMWCVYHPSGTMLACFVDEESARCYCASPYPVRRVTLRWTEKATDAAMAPQDIRSLAEPSEGAR